MNISKSGVLGRLYRWNYENLSDRHVIPESTNLCQFCRTIFVWLPMKFAGLIIIVLIVLLSTLYVFFIFIPDDLGWTFHYVFWICVASGFVGWYLSDNHLIPQPHFHVTAPEPVTVFWTWMVAKKQKICPFIDWTE